MSRLRCRLAHGLVAVIFAATCLSSHAQTMGVGTTPSVGFPNTALNVQASTNGTAVATLTFATAGELASYDFVIQSYPTSEFYDYGTGTCAAGATYAAGASCTVSIGFLPSKPGLKKGALRFKNSSGTIFAWVYVYGVGSAPIAGVISGVSKTFSLQTGKQIANPAPTSNGLVYGIDVDYGGNVFLAGAKYNNYLQYGTNGTFYTPILSCDSASNGIARDGLGAVFCLLENGDTTISLNKAYAPTQYVFTAQVTVIQSIGDAVEISVDPQGNFWILYGNTATKKYTWTPGTTANGGYVVSTPSTSAGLEANYQNLDAYGNLYTTVSGHLTKISFPNGVLTTTTIGAVPYNALAVDLAGDVYVLYGTALSVYIPTSSTAYTAKALGTLSNGGSLAVDTTGNLFASDGTNLIEFPVTDDVTQPLAWTDTPTAGTTDSNTPTVFVANVGTLPLTFTPPASGTNPSFPTAFSLANSSTCAEQTPASATQVLASANWCNAVLQFSPPSAGTFSGSVVFNTNSAAAATQSVPVSATAVDGAGTTTQTITFPQPAAIVYPAKTTATLTASSTSGLAIAYSVISGSATVSGAIVTITGAGPVVVEADQFGNGTYKVATAVQRTITVKGTPTIAWNLPSSGRYPHPLALYPATTTPPGTMNYTTTQGTTTTPVTLTSWLQPGTYTVTASFIPTDLTSYTAVTKSVSLSVTGPVIYTAQGSSGVNEFQTDTNTLVNTVVAGGAAFAVDQAHNVYSIGPTGTTLGELTDVSQGMGDYVVTTPAGMNASKAIAVDGSNAIWIANGDGTVLKVGSSATLASAAAITAPASLSISASGSLWMASPTSNVVTEVIGVATPTVPLITGIVNATPAAKP